MPLGQEPFTIEDQAGFLWTWWKGDLLPILPPLPGLVIEEAADVEVSCADVCRLLQQGHSAYIARMETLPVAVGWSAIGEASFGEGRVTFYVPAQNRYLYYFVTLPAFRGQGIYPHLLQHILRSESKANERFWIIHQLANTASQRGIQKAGFGIASQVHFLSTKGLGLVSPPGEMERARAGAALFGLSLIANSKV
jgi:GNAT superfamily N-acetyltransferase